MELMTVAITAHSPVSQVVQSSLRVDVAQRHSPPDYYSVSRQYDSLSKHRTKYSLELWQINTVINALRN